MPVEISQRMFSEIMSAFTEMFKLIMKTKSSEKRALFSIECSRGALQCVAQFSYTLVCNRYIFSSLK